MQTDFTLFDKSTELVHGVHSPNVYHQLFIPYDELHVFDPFEHEVAVIPKGCSVLVYPLLHYRFETTSATHLSTRLLSINSFIFESHLFSTNFFSKINYLVKRSDLSLLIVDEQTTAKIKPIYEKISNEFQLEWMIATLEILNLICTSPFKTVESTTSTEKHRLFFNQINDYISENIADTIDIKTIAGHFFLSESVFSHRFREIFNTSFHHYFLVKKIEKSCEMIKYSNKNIQEIGFALGFNSTSHFISTFKQIKHTTPGKYRKNVAS